jgi:hypothetical protein
VKLDLGTHKGMHSVLALKLGMTNKDLIISMSIKQEFMYPKRKKNKKRPPPPQFLSIQMKGLLIKKGAQIVLQDVFIFLKFRYTVLLRGYEG